MMVFLFMMVPAALLGAAGLIAVRVAANRHFLIRRNPSEAYLYYGSRFWYTGLSVVFWVGMMLFLSETTSSTLVTASLLYLAISLLIFLTEYRRSWHYHSSGTRLADS